MTGMTSHTGRRGCGRFTMTVVALWAVSGIAFAHHSFAMFDMSKTLTLAGTVTNFEWTNPHTWLWVQVPDGKGGKVHYSIEMNSPGVLERSGWTRHSIKVGDTVTATVHPSLAGAPIGLCYGCKVEVNGVELSRSPAAN